MIKLQPKNFLEMLHERERKRENDVRLLTRRCVLSTLWSGEPPGTDTAVGLVGGGLTDPVPTVRPQTRVHLLPTTGAS